MNDDENVWRELRGGRSAAFGVIWDRHHRRVFQHVLGMGTSPTDAEDITATAFLEAWRLRSRVRFVDGSLLPWLLVTSRNCARNAERSQRRYRGLLERLPRPDAPVDPAAVVEDRHGGRVRDALNQMKPIDAALVSLKAEGYTLRDAARALGISESAAKMRTLRLRQHLRTVETLSEGSAS